ncbi:MAG: toll/interleukin-1 receptor domain-containing protein [Lewinellaceae bacterium]|nr:toll/interleukin-1 receptor domain-containing protein [Lewinellaceae bacterium]
MKEQIQQLIATGQTEEALQLLVQTKPDAILLQARYNQGKKQYNMGLIEFGEWSRIQAQINYAALELAGSAKSPATHTGTGHTPASAEAPSNAKKVFISYNHEDKEIARQVRTFLEGKEMDVILDLDDLAAGRSILEFIQESIKKCDAVVSIVSGKSLQSGWVSQESVASMYAVWMADKKFIPVRLDDMVFDSKFQIMALKTINAKIQELDSDITEIRSLGSDARDLEDDRKRLFDLQKEFSTILLKLKSIAMTPINGDNFESGMNRVVASILAM